MRMNVGVCLKGEFPGRVDGPTFTEFLSESPHAKQNFVSSSLPGSTRVSASLVICYQTSPSLFDDVKA